MKSFNTSHILATLLFAHTALAKSNKAPALPNDSNTHTPPSPAPRDGFVEVRNGHFYVGEKLFNFKGMNAPNLNAATGNDFRSIDTFRTLAGLGAAVSRTYTLTIYNSLWGQSTSAEDAHIAGWDTAADNWIYNEAAFVKMDQMLARAAEYGLKLIIPIINQDYGDESTNYVGNFVDLIRHRHNISSYPTAQSKVDFFTDKAFRVDYKKIIDYLLTRKNTVNHRVYGQDDVILAWETGNEMNWASDNQTVHVRPAPAEWTIDIAKQLKTLAPKTLVMDGSFSRDPELSKAWPEESLKSEYVDLFSYHLWGSGDAALEPAMKAHIASYKKVFVVGEHGFYKTGEEFNSVITNFTCAGSLIWGMRSHHEEGGFVTHGEGDGIFSYHFPGWNNSTSANFDPRELAVARSTYENSWSFTGVDVPEYPIPGAPVLWDASTNMSVGITWQGAAWAEHYELWGAAASASSFELISDNLVDNVEGGELFVAVTPPKVSTATRRARHLEKKHGMTKRQHRRRATEPEVPAGDYEPPADDYEPPTGDYEPPTGDYEPPTGDYKPPTGDYGAPANGTSTGGWYILRGVSVDGKAGPWSDALFIDATVAPIA